MLRALGVLFLFGCVFGGIIACIGAGYALFALDPIGRWEDRSIEADDRQDGRNVVLAGHENRPQDATPSHLPARSTRGSARLPTRVHDPAVRTLKQSIRNLTE